VQTAWFRHRGWPGCSCERTLGEGSLDKVVTHRLASKVSNPESLVRADCQFEYGMDYTGGYIRRCELRQAGRTCARRVPPACASLGLSLRGMLLYLVGQGHTPWGQDGCMLSRTGLLWHTTEPAHGIADQAPSGGLPALWSILSKSAAKPATPPTTAARSRTGKRPSSTTGESPHASCPPLPARRLVAANHSPVTMQAHAARQPSSESCLSQRIPTPAAVA